MLTQKRIEEELRPIDGLDWITALRAPQIQKLVSDGVLQLWLFDDRDLAEITHPDYPGERLVVCRNPLLAEERKRKREELIKSAEKKLATIITATRRKKQPLKDISKINFRIGKELGPLKVAKYFQWEMHPEGLVVKRDEKRIQAERFWMALTSCVLPLPPIASTPMKPCSPTSDWPVSNALFAAPRTWTCMSVRSITVRPTASGRRSFFAGSPITSSGICAESSLPSCLMTNIPASVKGSAVTAAQRSLSAITKAHRKRTPDDFPVQSFQDWLNDLATIVRNRIQPTLESIPAFTIVTRPTPAQRCALDLLGVSL